MEVLQHVFHAIYLALSALGVAVVTVGVAEAALRYVRHRLFRAGDREFREEVPRIRLRLGEHLVLGLDVFIAADLVNSVIAPDWEKVGMLAAIVAIRVVLSLLLLREIRSARQEQLDGDGDG